MDAAQEILDMKRRFARLEAMLAHGLELADQSGGGGVGVCITAGGPGAVYTCDVYGDGHYDDAGNPQAATETGKTLRVDQIAGTETLPVGTWLTARPAGEHYEATVPIDL